MDSPSKQFVSTLIAQNDKISWMIQNVSELLENNCWTAYSIPMEVGFGPTGLSKWEISLHSSGKMLQARARLLAPEGQKVTHHLTFWIVRHGRPSSIQNSADFLKAKEAESGGPHTYWKIIPLEDLKEENSTGIVTPEDTMELIIQLNVFGTDLSQNSSYIN